jgi:glyoxylase-like metal-dependent hydrolase (beta-lactamase superfamily II)/ferredoxin
MREKHKLSANVPGSLYVNSACINCDTCRQLAPNTFGEVDGFDALYALVSCPTAAIVSEHKDGIAKAMDDLPLELDESVYYCGFTSAKSFGGSSYFITDPEGNWLIDSPRYVPHLVQRFADMGGIDTIFLTHRDDVADAEKYAEKFGAQRIIHIDEYGAQPGADHFIRDTEPIDWGPDFRIIPVPGHTKGHMTLLYKERYLFTGDHLEWDRDLRQLSANEEFCWYSWEDQTESMEKLAKESFEWVLPGHGDRVQLDPEAMNHHMQKLIRRMKRIRR